MVGEIAGDVLMVSLWYLTGLAGMLLGFRGACRDVDAKFPEFAPQRLDGGAWALSLVFGLFGPVALVAGSLAWLGFWIGSRRIGHGR